MQPRPRPFYNARALHEDVGQALDAGLPEEFTTAHEAPHNNDFIPNDESREIPREEDNFETRSDHDDSRALVNLQRISSTE